VRRGSVLRLIRELDDLPEALGRSKLQFCGLPLPEERLAVAYNDGKDREIDRIEQTVMQQCLREAAVTQDEEVTAISLVTSATTSPRMIVELFHSALSSLAENTYFGIALSRAAYAGVPPPSP